MSEHWNTARALVAGVLRMVAVVGLLSVVLGACIYVVAGELGSRGSTAEVGDVQEGMTGALQAPHGGESPARIGGPPDRPNGTASDVRDAGTG